MTTYEEMYEQFLQDMDGESEDRPSIYEEPASFEQIRMLHSLLESNAMNALSDREAALIASWISGEIKFYEASMLIDKILQAQPDEAPIHSQKELAKWLREKKLID